MAELLFKQEVYLLIGAAMEVYNELGPGFLEPVYQQALELELANRNIPFEVKKEIRIFYKGTLLEKRYEPDLLVFKTIIVELKALHQLTVIEEAQLLNYLKATGLSLGVLINFCCREKLEWKRMIYTKDRTTNRTNLR